MNTKRLFTSALLLAIFISCNHSKKETVDADYKTEELKVQDKALAPAGFYQTVTDSAVQPPPQSPLAKQVPNPDWDKKIIKTATLNVEVADFKKYNESVHKTIRQYGGYVAQEEQNLSDSKLETTISIKVPVDQFETMMDELPSLSAKVLEKKITTEDVTGDVVDTKSRLEAKKQMRLKYLDFLKQSKNMEEVLQVQNEINSIQEEIESAAGRINYLSHQSSFSTINLTFFQPVIGFTAPADDKPGFLKRLSYAFNTGLEWFANLIVGLASIWPLVLVILFFLVVWKRSRASKPIRQNV